MRRASRVPLEQLQIRVRRGLQDQEPPDLLALEVWPQIRAQPVSLALRALQEIWAIKEILERLGRRAIPVPRGRRVALVAQQILAQPAGLA